MDRTLNSIIREYYPVLRMYQELRDQLMGVLTDEDLAYRLPGNPSLSALCREIGEVELSYIQSFQTFTQNFSYRSTEPGLESSVRRLSKWFADLDRDLRETVEALSEDDVQNRLIDRGHDFKVKPLVQLETYKEALLIFYGKASAYMKAMGKTPSERWKRWIG